jgi:glyoxylate reductase
MSADNPLLAMENVAILPHIGSATIEARDRMAEMVALNIIAFVRGETVPNRIVK